MQIQVKSQILCMITYEKENVISIIKRQILISKSVRFKVECISIQNSTTTAGEFSEGASFSKVRLPSSELMFQICNLLSFCSTTKICLPSLDMVKCLGQTPLTLGVSSGFDVKSPVSWSI